MCGMTAHSDFIHDDQIFISNNNNISCIPGNFCHHLINIFTNFLKHDSSDLSGNNHSDTSNLATSGHTDTNTSHTLLFFLLFCSCISDFDQTTRQKNIILSANLHHIQNICRSTSSITFHLRLPTKSTKTSSSRLSALIHLTKLQKKTRKPQIVLDVLHLKETLERRSY